MRGANFPNMPFNQEVSFPCELTLHGTPKGLRIFREPIPEIALLHQGGDAWTNLTVHANEQLPLEPSGQSFQIQAELGVPAGTTLTFNVLGVPVVLTTRTIASGGNPVLVAGEVSTVEILVDRGSIEAFVNHGEISSTRYVLPSENGISVKAEGGDITLSSLHIYPLKSAWSK
jgi:levanase/fructan beta-fructosidase